MHMKRYSLAVTVLLLCTNLSLSAQVRTDVSRQFAKELQLKSSKIQNIKCAFKQTQSLSVLNNKIVRQGTFYYKRPENILLAFDNGDYINMSSDYFSMKNAGKSVRMKMDKNPMLRELKKILAACMTGNVLEVADEFKSEVSGYKTGYVLTLIPKKKKAALKIKSITLRFNRADMCLDQMVMQQANGDFTQYDFSEKQINTHLKVSVFNNIK